MPVQNDNTFARIWKFVDQFAEGDPVTRTALDAAFDDLVYGINAALGGAQNDPPLTAQQIEDIARRAAEDYLDRVTDALTQALAAAEQASTDAEASALARNKAECFKRDVEALIDDAKVAVENAISAQGRSEAAQAIAEAARDAALAGAQGVFGSLVAGLAATADGERFILADQDGWSLYENVAGESNEISGTFPSLTTLNDLLAQNIHKQAVAQGRPAELLERYTSSLTGDRESGPPVNAAVVANAAPYGNAIDVGPSQIVAMRDAIWLDTDIQINLRATFRMQNNSCDPEGERVTVGVEWLDATYSSVGQEIIHNNVVVESDGWITVERVVNATPVDRLYGTGINAPFDQNADDPQWADQDSIYECPPLAPAPDPAAPDPGPYPNPFIAPPAGASYLRLFIQTNGNDGVTRIAALEAMPSAISVNADRITYPLGFTFPEEVIPPDRIKRTIFVRQDGDDTEDGRSLQEAVRSIERARDLVAEDDCVKYSIQLWPGDYETAGHIDIPDNCSEIVGMSGQRSARIFPTAGNSVRNVFRGGDGFMLRNVSGMGWQVDDFEDPSEGFLVAFRPGATIFRTLYIDHCVMYRGQEPDLIPAPLDPENGNPAVPRGPGIALADGDVVSPYSPFPQMMIEASTTSAPNGVGYCVKGNAFINALNTISLWPHRHFMALRGGELLINNCATQFGDYTLWSEGSMGRIILQDTAGPLVVDSAASTIIEQNRTPIINAMWNAVVAAGFARVDRTLSERDAGLLVTALRYDLLQASQESVDLFLQGLYPGGVFVGGRAAAAFVAGWEGVRSAINGLGISANARAMVSGLIDVLIAAVQTPEIGRQPSKIGATAHQFNFPFAGVNRRAFARPQRDVRDTIVELDLGDVIFSGLDDLGKQYFTGGALVNPITGQFEGPPVDRTINPRAMRAAIIAGGQQ